MHVSRTPTKSPQGWVASAPAKLNLYLDVLGKRADGFHELDTLMVPVRRFDTLSWTSTSAEDANPFCFRLANPTSAETPTDETNLVVQAVHLLAQEAGLAPNGNFVLTKRIPTQAGMGGGSSDAAAALMLANRAWDINYPNKRLARLAAKLGSDVPFFLAGGPAICQGRGERITTVAGFPKLHLVVVKPKETVSTRAAFASLKARPYGRTDAADGASHSKSLIDLLRRGRLSQATSLMRNSFQDVICQIEPNLQKLWQILKEINPWGALMTGSGSAFFCLCRSAKHANYVAGKLRSHLHWNQWGRRETISETALGGAHDRIHGKVWTTSTCH